MKSYREFTEAYRSLKQMKAERLKRESGHRHKYEADPSGKMERSRSGKELLVQHCSVCGKTRRIFTATGKVYNN